ncbi:coiled-coil domain-containing protein 22-like [Sphaerodactylus townsendi]|uniref:coiled-coil domain-containing protein 22-like n=1 Tax=Sphaerodactylus townsendi TaxID=933632 RepID=UPI002025DFA5|nr:coiled-coil domain-containing protein 22-like [Sphaerodactylus townsendi]
MFRRSPAIKLNLREFLKGTRGEAEKTKWLYLSSVVSQQEEEPTTQIQTLPISRTSEQELQERQAVEVEALESEMGRLVGQIEELEGQMATLGLTLTQVEGEVRRQQLGVTDLEQTLRVKGRTVELLPDAENNMAKLQVVVESSAQRIVQLAAQWEKHRVPLVQEFRELKALHDSKELESSQRLLEIRELHERIRSAADEAKRKDDLYKQLVSGSRAGVLCVPACTLHIACMLEGVFSLCHHTKI